MAELYRDLIMECRNVRTSITDPLEIASIYLDEFDSRIGLTFCPGKQAPSAFGGMWKRDLTTDLVTFKSWGCRTVVTLMEQHELDEFKVSQLGDRVQECGMEWIQLPIGDGGIPDDNFVERWNHLGLLLRQRLRNGESIIVHCRGGLGRTGTLVAQLLIEMGNGPEEAIDKVRRVRPGAIENSIQEGYVKKQLPIGPDKDIHASRVLGCLLGGALGDALGYQVEFDSLREIHRKFGPDGVRLPINGEAVVSDDTQMTLFTLEGLIRARGNSINGITESIQMAYLDWYQTQQHSPIKPSSLRGQLATEAKLQVTRAPGNTCINALSTNLQGRQPTANNSKGCGTVMRVAPIGFYDRQLSDEESYELGVRTSGLTHGHPTAKISGGAMALLIRKLITGIELSQAVNEVLEHLDLYEDEEVSNAIKSALVLTDNIEIPHSQAINNIHGDSSLGKSTSRGWVAEEALAIGIYAALVGNDLSEVISIAANHNGDSDSTASIAGQIYGAWKGITYLPNHKETVLDIDDIIISTARLMEELN